MKLFDVPCSSTIRVLENPRMPPESYSVSIGEEIKFIHLDGMYSLCKKKDGDFVHLAAWTEVEIVKEKP